MVFQEIFSGTTLCSAPSWRTGIKSRMGTESFVLPLLAQRGFIQRYNSFFLFRALNFYRKWQRVGHHGPPCPNACLWSLKFVKITVTWPSRADRKWRKFPKLRFWGHSKVRTVALRLNYKMLYPGSSWDCALIKKSLPHTANWWKHSWYPPLKQPVDDKVSNTRRGSLQDSES